MQQIQGIWFPEGDQHFAPQLDAGPLIDGKGTYQLRKYLKALPFIPNKGHAVDIGGHVGLWSRIMVMNFERVTAFEPMPEHVKCFKRNLGHADNVTLHQTALSDNRGPLRFHWEDDHTGHTHVSSPEDSAAGVGRKINAVRLDSFELTDIDFLKIDVEGFERPVLIGGRRTIQREKPVIVIEQKPNGDAERYGRGRFDALDLLKSWGWREAWEVGGDFCMLPPS